MKRRISSSVMSPWRIWCEGTREASERTRAASCSADISSEKKPTTPPSTAPSVPSGLVPLLVGAGDVEGDVGRERGLAHRRAAGEDQQVRGVQAAEPLVEVDEAGREAGEAAVALVGGVRHLDRVDDGAAEGLEAACRPCPARRAGRAPARPRRSGPCGSLSTSMRAGLVGDVLAEQDQLAADREVVDQLGVVAGGEERDRRAGEAHEVGRRRRARAGRRRPRRRP